MYIIYERILLICILSLVDINWHLNQLVTDLYQPLIQVALKCGNTEVSRFFLLRNVRNIILLLQEFQVLKISNPGNFKTGSCNMHACYGYD